MEHKSTLDYAIYYTKEKNFSVIPLIGKIPDASVLPKEPNEKGEMKPTWKPYQKRKPTTGELREWFGNGNKRNIGIVTGSISGIAVVDTDGAEAVQLAKDLELPATPHVKTGRGFHAYYQYKDGIRNFQKRDDLPGIDLRGDGGYVVAPPSIHASGAQYAWVEGKPPDDMAEFPEILLARHGNNNHKPPVKELYRGAIEGSRNDTLARLAGSWVHNGLSLEDCIENAYTWNTRNNPPLPEREVEQTVESIYNRDKGDKGDKGDVSYSSGNNNILDETIESVLPVISFPMEGFSERFKQTIEKISTSFNVDADVCASIALPVMSAAIGNTVRVSPKSGWEVSPFIWMVPVADSGYGKTHPINCFVKPIDKKQARAYREYHKLMTVYNSEMAMFRKDKNKELPEKPALEQYKSSDFTVESLADVFENQPRGVLIHQDEISGLVLAMNQYKSGKGNDRQHLLELFNGDSWKIDRKSGSRFIPNTGAGIIGGLQPQIMPKVFGHDSFDDGLLPRFLFVTASNKTQRFNRQGVTNDDLSYWYDLIEYCYEIPLKINDEGYVEPRLLIFSDDALNLWEGFYNEFHTIKGFLPNRVKVFIPKLITYSLKLAGILHVLKEFEAGKMTKSEESEGTPYSKNGLYISRVISVDVIEEAIRLTRFYAGQVSKIVRQYNKPEPEMNEYENIIIQALMDLQGEVKNLKLPLGRITEVVNTMLPERLKFEDNKNIGSILRKLGFQTRLSTGKTYYFIWEYEKVKNLHRRTSPLSPLSPLSPNDEPFNGQF